MKKKLTELSCVRFSWGGGGGGGGERGKLPRTRYLTPYPFLFREEWFMVHFMIIHMTVLNRKVYSVTNYLLEWSLPGFLA